MPLPVPEPGLVIQYEFLWRDEHKDGRDSGRKDRPCVIVVAVTEPQTGRKIVYVAPITHRPPTPPEDGVEIPLRLKQALGLDHLRSWVIVSELNYFDWPGVDLRPVPGGAQQFTYGLLPPRFFTALKRKILDRTHNFGLATPRSG